MLKIFLFLWPSNLGGADTRLKELIQCFSYQKNLEIFCIPNDSFRLQEKHNTDFLDKYGVKYLSWEDLPEKSEGFAISFCNFRLFSEQWRIQKIKSMGLKFIWSNDMMWHTNEETWAFENKLIDGAIYTSHKHYQDMTTNVTKNAKEFIIPNYFHLSNYEYIERPIRDTFTIGKHSRADKMKFSDNFPLFYEDLKIKNPKYRVMGFNKKIKENFEWFDFNSNWDLLNENKEDTIDFLKSLDCYVYNSHHTFTETQCRATIEAMLTGLPVIAPTKDNFFNQIWHGKSGFLWSTYEECQKYVKFLEENPHLRIKMGKLAREISKELWCDAQQHFQLWNNIFFTV
jgi:glycosyltransferase involved in cell wall biosynthesis